MSEPTSSPARLDEPADEQAVRRLEWWERLLAGIPGLAAAGFGCYSVFVSDNQAGSTTLIAFGALFLLLAVQGTAVRRATRDSVELERRQAAHRVAEKAMSTAEEEGPGPARAIIEGAAVARPEIARNPEIRLLNASLYEKEILEALTRVWVDEFGESPSIVVHATAGPDLRRDAILSSADRSQESIGIELAYMTQGLIPRSRIERTLSQLDEILTPLLIIGNRPLSRFASDLLASHEGSPPVHFVRWRGPEDDKALARGITLMREFYTDKG